MKAACGFNAEGAMDIRRALPTDREVLLDIWLRSVRATHAFVSADDIEAMIPQVSDYLASGETEFRGGRRLVRHAQARQGELTVDVNAQNAAASDFHEACGCVVEGRSEPDDRGRPYPLLHMRLAGAR